MTTLHSEAATDPVGPDRRSWPPGSPNSTLDDVPAHVVDRAKHLLLDGVGCALIGAQLPWSRVATDARPRSGGRG